VADSLKLTGRVIGVTADRRGDDQAVLFGRMGAEVLVGPTMATVKVPDPELLRLRTEELIAEPPDFVIANTGIGIRTWLAAAGDWGLEKGLVAALGRTRVAARGPKAAGALSSAGVPAWWRSPDEQLDGVIRHLAGEGLTGKRVAFQLHGDDGSEHVRRMEAAGARVSTIPVYLWRIPDDRAPALELIRRTVGGEVDAVTFTAGPQVHSMLEMARTEGQEQALLDALNRDSVVVGCIGPVCAAAAAAAGVEQAVVPDNWRLGSLVKLVAEALTAPRT
jgi:uroporphyrinogen-III synthase